MNAFDIFEDTQVKIEFETAFAKLSDLEEIQLLSDLKYLPNKAFLDGIIEPAERARAIVRFRSEYQQALNQPGMSNLSQIDQESKIVEFEPEKEDQLTKREIYVLKEITGLDQEFIIKQVTLNQCTLLSRILIYRYRVYGRVTKIQSNHRLTPVVRDDLDIAARETGYQGDWLSFGNLLADQAKLSSFFMTAPIFTKDIFGDCIFIMPKSPAGKEVIDELGKSITRRKLFLGSITAVNPKTKFDVEALTKRNNPAQVKGYIDQVANVFLRRMLQVKLWMTGLYRGKLDHDFGPVSITALNEFLMTLSENSDIGRDERGRILYNLGDDQCVVNIRYLFTKFLIPMETAEVPEEQKSISHVFDFVLEDKSSMGKFNESEQEEIQENSTKLTNSLSTELQNESKAIIDPTTQRRRQYHAKKGIGKFFSKVFKWVKNAFTKLIKLFEKLFGLIEKAAKFIYNEVREAFQKFKTGLAFLFGNRIIDPTPVITTDYGFDFDGITRIHTKPTSQELKTHIKALQQASDGLSSTLKFVQAVIKWGIRIATAGTFGWVKILIGIAKIFIQFR